MMSHEYPLQLVPPDFLRIPNGAFGMAFEVSDLARPFRKFTSSVAVMWPYLLRSHVTIVSGSLETQAAPGVGDGLGEGAGAGAGVRNTCVPLHALVVWPSPARARQYIVAAAVSGLLLNVVCPDPSAMMPAEISFVNAWSEATWNSYASGPTGPTMAALPTTIAGVSDAATALLTGDTGAGGFTAAGG